jgi:4-hydroxyphenylacetaldehyde oxime monooxygenase
MATTTTPLLLSNLLRGGVQQQWQMGLLALMPVLLVSSYLVLTSRRSWRKSAKDGGVPRLPPGPVQLPVLGNLHVLGPLPHQNLRELARRHGPVMLLRLGTVSTVVVSSAEAAREMLKVHDVDCCSRPASVGPKRLSYGFKDVAFAPYGAYWREMRRLVIVELLSTRRVKAAWSAREQQVDKLVANLTRAAGEPVALDEHTLGLSDGIIGTVALGSIYGTEWFADRERRFLHVLREGVDMVASFSAEDFFPNAIGRLVDRLTGLAGRRERIFRDLDDFCEMVIDQHTDPARPKPNNGGDLVDALIDLCDEEKEQRGTFRFTREHVKAVLINTFLAGIDGVAVTLLWAMSEMMRKPHVLRKAQDEVRVAVGAGAGGKPRVEPDDMARLPYLKMVVKETLRLHPPVTLNARETIRDVRVCGYDVPAKTRVLVNLWAIGRDPASWSDAEAFQPDRFDGSDIDYSGAHFELLAFGAGRRICPGLAMAEANITFALANLLYCFDWALLEGMKPEDVSMEEAGRLIFKPKNPLLLVPTRRL